ncbi:MAG: universal stress protein [Nitrospirota bacterium]
MKIEKILFTTKFRELTFNALESLFVLKDADLKEVVLSYIIPREDVAFVPYGGYLKKEEERLREETRMKFEDWQKALSEKGVDSKIIIEVGEPVPKILSIAEREKVDLIVAGRKKRTVEKLHLGSCTLEILRRSPIPVLVNKYMVQFEWAGEIVTRINDRIFDKPLIATDWSEPSNRAFDLLLSLKNVVKEAAICHVIGEKILKGKDKSELYRLENENTERLERYCKILRNAGIKAEFHLSSGDTTSEILRIARELRASMIIVGTTGKDRLHELLPGSVSHRIADISELPTLLVP